MICDMSESLFIHLDLHSEFSIVDSLVRIPALIDRAAELGMPAVALTDHSNLFGMVKFYQKALEKGVKPIIGVDVWIENPEEAQKPFRLILLCQNNKGYKNLCILVSKAYVENQQFDKPLIKKEWLGEFAEGLMALSGGIEGELGYWLFNGQLDKVQSALTFYQQMFSQRFYIELQRTGRSQEDEYIHAAVKWADQYHLPVVATNAVCFLNKEDYEAHEARVCVNSGWILNDAKRPRHYSDQQYLRSTAEMIDLFSDIPEAIENTVEIAKRCNLTLTLGKIFMPHFPVPEGETVEEYLSQASHHGLEKRLQKIKTNIDKQIYFNRLNQELEVINHMGFSGYFLIVADFIDWAKNNDVPVGPGRGSGAGSLVAYSLGITDLDPLQYDLLFERFLNPERVSMPDFDVDFCMDGRDRVIDYVAEKYGRESVSQIITYGTMAAKAVIRDVGRVLGFSYGFVDKLAKLIPFEIGMTLEKALEDEPVLMARYTQEEEVRTLIDLAKKLEGITRNAGKHAGGVVIAPSLLTDFSPLYCEPGGVHLVTQFDKNDVEAAGLVKFDFLGLRTLTIINWALHAINNKLKEKHQEPIDILLIPLDDSKTFDLLKACQTTAVFQLESRGMKELIKRLQPDCFEEIIALVALFRPGPLQSGMVDDFINRKHGREDVIYPHPLLKPVLKPTYGVILYQEQVMQIAQELAGYTLGGADILRRAMGKKKPAEMAKQRAIFVDGAEARGVRRELSSNIFDLIEKFAGYGFNKSHSAAYALIAYQTAWLKAHYPAEFMAAVLSSDMDNTDKVVNFINECEQMKLSVISPHINRSQYKFVVEGDDIVFGLGAIKGAGEAAIEIILAERKEQGPFKDLFEFCRRMDLRKVNRRVIEALIKSGAMDGMGPDRGVMLASIDDALKAADQHAQNQAGGQIDLFGGMDFAEDHLSPQFVRSDPLDENDLLAFEKETLGYYVSGHPISQYEDELEHFITCKIVDLRPKQKETVIVAGLVMAIRTMNTRRGDRMAFVNINDRSAGIEVAIFSDVYEQYRSLIQKGQLLIVEGEASVDDYTGGYKISANKIFSIEHAREIFAKNILICLNHENSNTNKTIQIKEILKQNNMGNCPVCIEYQQRNAKTLIPLGAEWRVKPTDQLIQSLQKIVSPESIRVVY